MNIKSAACVALLALGLSTAQSPAMFMIMDQDVPTKQIVEQVEKIIKDKPKDAHAHYVLGRVHSLAWAQGGAQVTLTPKGNDLPEFGPTQSVQVRQRETDHEGKAVPAPTTQAAETATKHLEASIASYRKAVELDPKNGLYHLGLGWMLEQKLASERMKEKDKDNSPAKAREIVAIYVKAFDLTLERDLKSENTVMASDTFVSVESANNALRLIENYPDPDAEKDKALGKRLQEGRDKVMARPIGITPVIIAAQPGATLASLVNEDADVGFDLAGMGTGHRWPWVQPTTGVLVWDPKQMGQITSGRQLFGTMTWQMLFRDGYEALSMLDSDRDGKLAGSELAPVGVWFDADADGISDPGEVTAVPVAGITSLSVRATRDASGTLAIEQGVTWSDGRRTPSYDWVPTSKPLTMGNSGKR